MKNRGIKIYITYTVLLLLAGAAVLVVGNNALNRYERDQEKLNREKVAGYTATPTPTQEVVIVEKYKYMVKLPMSLEVTAENAVLTGTEEGEKTYAIEASAEGYEVGVRDLYGNEAVLRYGEKLETVDYKMVIPDNFRVEMKNGADASAFITSVTDHEDYKWCYEFADMPRLAEYSFDNALAAPEFKVIDNLGNEILPEWENESFYRTGQTVLPEIEEDVMSREEAVRYIKMWSAFMSDELGAKYIFKDKNGNVVPYEENMNTSGLTYTITHPSDHGFSLLKDYLLPDTYRYKVLRGYAYGDDINLSSKIEPDPKYKDLALTNFVRYGEDIFSVDVYFKKIFRIWSTTYSYWYQTNEYTTNARVFFMKDHKTDKWLIADIYDIINE
ncbi:MAG: hypothetical protein K6G60_02900 [Lachnospiraceae bacterium]|nr:hypothetical protein [Lachnospiraceae bacterium]